MQSSIFQSTPLTTIVGVGSSSFVKHLLLSTKNKKNKECFGFKQEMEIFAYMLYLNIKKGDTNYKMAGNLNYKKNLSQIFKSLKRRNYL